MTSSGVVGSARVVFTADIGEMVREAKAELGPAMKELGATLEKSIATWPAMWGRAGAASGEAFAAAATKAALAGFKELGVESTAQFRAVAAAAVKSSAQQVAANDRVTESTTQSTRARARDAKVAAALADADQRLAAIKTELTGASNRVVEATLRDVAAQQRAAAAHAEAGSAAQLQARELARLATADAGAIASQRRLATAQGAALARLAAAGRNLSKFVTLPVAALAAVSIKQAMDFQKSMTLIQTAGGETEAKAKAISAGIKVIATATGTSLNQLGEGIYTVAKAGAQKWSAAGQLEVLRAAAQGAKAEAVPLGTAVDALSTIMLDYGAKTGDAVKYENMLIRGSGLAKTSMTEYAGALSNVIPIGAAVGLSFKELGGAIATMTQHGVSPQQATQNLRNLITNLAGQNNVASSAMQQLGINTVDLAQNLGKRGLSGTLAIVDKALALHSKNGMVVVDVHKAASLATKSLNTEMGTFTGKLATQSKELLTGKVGITDYTKYAKSLGGTAGAGALQFLALYKSSQGFSDQLKSGKGTVTTTTAALNKMLGGITGSSVAMQIGGKYAAQNARNITAIGKAALTAGSDVLGWNKTQDTLAVKMDKARASLEVMAVELGSKLIPAVASVAREIAGAIHWFEGLSHTQKEMLGWSVGVVAALGPAITIITRLGTAGRGLTLLATRIATFAGASEAGALRVGTAMRGMGAAMAGVGIGVAMGTLSKNSDTAGKAVAALTAAGAGAAVGFAVGGPLGAAIGGIGGGVASLATNWLNAGDASKKSAEKQAAAARAARAAVDAQRQAVDTLAQSIQNDTDKIGANTRAQVTNDLRRSGALKLAATAGLNLANVTGAAMGRGKSRAALNAQLSKIESAALSAPGGLVSSTTSQAIAKLLPLLRSEGILVGKAGVEADLTAAANGRLSFATRTVSDQTSRYGTALDNTSIAGRANIKFIGDHITALDTQLSKGKLTDAQWVKQVGTLQTQLKQYGFNTSAVNNYAASFAHLPKSVITKLLADPKIANSTLGQVLRLIGTVPKTKNTTLTATDHATPTVTGLGGILDAEMGIRTVVLDAKITANAARAASILNKFGGSAIISTRGIGIAGKATGAIIRGPGGPTDDRAGVYALSDGEAVIPARAVAANMGVVQALIAQGRGLAGGGLIRQITGLAKGGVVGGSLMDAIKAAGFTGHAAQIMYGIVMAESGGNARAHNGNAGTGDNSYGLAQINMLGSMGPARRAQYGLSSNSQLYDPATNLRIAYAMSHHGTKFSDWSTYNRGDYEQYLGQSGAKITNGGKGGGSFLGVNGQTYASARAAQNAMVRAQQNLAKELPKFSKAVAGTTAQLGTAETALLNDLKAVGASSSKIAAVQKDFANLNRLAAKRDAYQAQLGTPSKAESETAYQKLTDALGAFAQEKSTVTQAQLSGFNVFTAGQPTDSGDGSQSPGYSQALSAYQSGYALTPAQEAQIAGAGGGFDLASSESSLATQTQTLKARKAELDKLTGEGISKTLLQTLAEGGADADPLLQALAGGSKTDALAYSKQYGQLQSVASSVGQSAAQAIVGEQLQTAKDQVALLKQEIATSQRSMEKLTGAVERIGGDVAHALNGVAGKAHEKARGNRYTRPIEVRR